MEAFPNEFTEHNLPLVILSGLGEDLPDSASPSELASRENGTQIRLASAPCGNDKVTKLRDQFLEFDGSRDHWNASSLPGPAGKIKYKIKAIGRKYALPPRKAAPAAQPTSSDSFQNRTSSPQRSAELHSPLSPQSPGSPVFPDGVFTPLWFSKHQKLVPSLILGFFDITAVAQSDQDDQIKADINAVRAALVRSGYRTKFTVVLLSDQSILQDSRLEERTTSIRRSTGLDSKTGLFFMPPASSQAEIATFVRNLMKTLQPLAVDFYRDLTKHARRKKARVGSSTPVSSPVGGPSAPLPPSGWNVRYEIKQGVFAEFRQEMDVAERHFAAALEELFGAEGILEFTPTWSPRWNDARLLSDCLALRVIRCQLWNSAPSSAAQSWSKYRLRVRDLIERRGKGSKTYSWAAWEARWAESMAQLIIRADLSAFRQLERQEGESAESKALEVYAASEKAVTVVDRMSPYHNLHHPGYWLRLAAQSSRTRKQKASEIPEEDLIPPGQSPASAVVRRSRSYDVYLALEPHEESPLATTSSFNHTGECTELTKRAIENFRIRKQSRIADWLQLDMARDFISANHYDEAMKVLKPLWNSQSWRDDGWSNPLHELLRLLRQCAAHLHALDVLVATTYELLSIEPALPDETSLDLANALKEFPEAQDQSIKLRFKNQQRLCPISVSFAFENKETSVGESIACQLALVSCMNQKSAPLNISSISLAFDNSRTITIHQDPEIEVTDGLVYLRVGKDRDEAGSETKANLTMRAMEQRILHLYLTFKEARNVRLTEVALAVEAKEYAIRHSFTDPILLKSDHILVPNDAALVRKYLPEDDPTVITVLPKPPKVQITAHGQKKKCYLDEIMRLNVEVFNGEEEAIDGSLSCETSGEADPAISVRWVQNDSGAGFDGSENDQKSELSAVKKIPHLQSGASCRADLLLKAPSEPRKALLEISVSYVLSSDGTTTIRKVTSLELNFTALFDANFNFGPMLYMKPWPNYFQSEHGSSRESSGGIPQLWCLNTRVFSFAVDTIVLHSAQLKVDSVNGDSLAVVRILDGEKNLVKPNESQEYLFDLYTEKHSLDDRRSTSIESTLEITWSRDPESDLVTTKLAVPRLTLPVSEPRVLCVLENDENNTSDAILGYYIENPSTHFLTFALTMEASEDFAFSGPKHLALSLAPLSRHRVEYAVLLQDHNDAAASAEVWIWPVLQVVDSYFQRTLRVLPGGPNVKLDEKQGLGVQIQPRQIQV